MLPSREPNRGATIDIFVYLYVCDTSFSFYSHTIHLIPIYTSISHDFYDTNNQNPTTFQHTTSIIMSAAYEGQDPIAIAKQAEADLNSQGAKQSHRVDDTARGPAGASDSSMFH